MAMCAPQKLCLHIDTAIVSRNATPSMRLAELFHTASDWHRRCSLVAPFCGVWCLAPVWAEATHCRKKGRRMKFRWMSALLIVALVGWV